MGRKATVKTALAETKPDMDTLSPYEKMMIKRWNLFLEGVTEIIIQLDHGKE